MHQVLGTAVQAFSKCSVNSKGPLLLVLLSHLLPSTLPDPLPSWLLLLKAPSQAWGGEMQHRRSMSRQCGETYPGPLPTFPQAGNCPERKVKWARGQLGSRKLPPWFFVKATLLCPYAHPRHWAGSEAELGESGGCRDATDEPTLRSLTPPGMNAQVHGCSSSSQSHPTFPLDLLRCLAECSKNSAKCREEGWDVGREQEG